MPGAVLARAGADVAAQLLRDGEDGDEREERLGDSLAEEGRQDLAAFARELRRAMVAMVRREDAVAEIREQCKGREGVGANVGPNGCREVEITVDRLAVVRMVIADSGLVEKAIVRDLEKDGGPRRRKSIERAILARGGRVDGMVERMMKVVQATLRL
jgi:hypothetical protein